MVETWHILNSGSGEPAWNMAFDEALLEKVSSLGRPVLRFYGWTQPAGTFGYSQKYTEVERVTLLRPLIRRPTGGGLVPHDADWTYSLAFPPGHSWYELKAVESYQRVHEWLRSAFAKMDVVTILSPCCQKEIPGQCFIGAEKFDLLWSGRKIAGAAQRRNKQGLLIQGSVQPPPIHLRRSDWENGMLQTAEEQWQVTWSELKLGAEINGRAGELCSEKYSQLAFNCRR